MEHERFRELIAATADPKALRDNPFRVLGVPADASGEALEREVERRRREQSPAHVEPSAGDMLRRLQDPQQRLVDELWWLWPDEIEADTGHNAAIAKLYIFAGEGEDPLSTWGEALAAMTTSLRAPDTVTYLAARATALNDPRVTARDARTLVDEAPLLVPLLALRMAAGAHDEGRVATARQLAARVRSEVDPALAAKAARIVVEARLQGLREAAQTARRDAMAAPRLAAPRARMLVGRAKAERSCVEALADPADPVLADVTDEVVESVLACVSAYHDGTGDALTVPPILRSAVELGPGPTVRTRLDERLKSLQPHAPVVTRRLVRPRPVSDWSPADLLPNRGDADPAERNVSGMDPVYTNLLGAWQAQAKALREAETRQAEAEARQAMDRAFMRKVATWVVIIVSAFCILVGWVGQRDLNEVRAFERPPVTVRIVGTTCSFWIGAESRDSTCEGTWNDPDDGSARRGTVKFDPDEDLPDVRGEQVRAHVFGDRAYVGDPHSEGWKTFARMTPWLIAVGVLGLVAACAALGPLARSRRQVGKGELMAGVGPAAGS